jgi:hypothetical protein
MNRDELKTSAWIVVLSDDDTYTGLDGCWIATTTPDQVKEGNESGEIPEGLKRIPMQDLLIWAIDNGYFDQ